MDKDPMYGPNAQRYITKTAELDITDYREFENEAEAVTFAMQNEGVILVPAKVNMSIAKPEEVF